MNFRDRAVESDYQTPRGREHFPSLPKSIRSIGDLAGSREDLRATATRRSAVIRPTADGRRVGDDASDRVVMVSRWLLPRKVSVVDPGNFVGPTTRSPARLASPFPFLSLCLSLMGKTFQLFAPR